MKILAKRNEFEATVMSSKQKSWFRSKSHDLKAKVMISKHKSWFQTQSHDFKAKIVEIPVENQDQEELYIAILFVK